MPQLVSKCHHTLFRCVIKAPAVLTPRCTTEPTIVSHAVAATTEGRSARDKNEALLTSHGQLMQEVANANPFSQRQIDIRAECFYLLQMCYFPIFP